MTQHRLKIGLVQEAWHSNPSEHQEHLARSIFSAAKQACDAQFLTGDDLTYLASMAVGGIGCISVLSNVFPREMKRMGDLWQQGNLKEALQLHEALFPLMQALFWETNPCPLKALMSEMKLCENVLRLPLGGISEQNNAAIRDLLCKTRTVLNYG